MNILLNVPYSLFEASTKKNYNGPLHFSSMLIKSIAKSKHSFTAIVFERTKPHPKPYLKSRLVRQGKNSWLVLSVWIATSKIVSSKRKSDPETMEIVDKIRKVIAKTQPDVYFLNGFSGLTFLIMQAIHDLGTPTVCTHHGIWLKEYMALNPRLIKTPLKYRKEMEKDTVRNSDKNIFLSNLSLEVFEKELIKVPKNNLEMVKIPYNPKFLNKEYPKKSANKTISLLMVGRWDAVKNHEGYLALAKRIKEKGLPWKIYSVCNIGNYAHHDDIREEYHKYIQVLPTTDAKGLKKLYKNASVVVVPSHFDVYPGVVTESLLQNRPALISPNVGWIDEYKRHGLENWIIDFKNPDKVIERIKKVSKQQVPKSLYKEVLYHNEPAHVFKKYFEIFEEAAKTHGNK